MTATSLRKRLEPADGRRRPSASYRRSGSRSCAGVTQHPSGRDGPREYAPTPPEAGGTIQSLAGAVPVQAPMQVSDRGRGRAPAWRRNRGCRRCALSPGCNNTTTPAVASARQRECCSRSGCGSAARARRQCRAGRIGAVAGFLRLVAESPGDAEVSDVRSAVMLHRPRWRRGLAAAISRSGRVREGAGRAVAPCSASARLSGWARSQSSRPALTCIIGARRA
jgi:hypothetical protein